MRKTIAESVASEVRAELARQRRPQRELAELLGISIQQIGLRLRGEVDWRVSELVQVADLLDVPITQFLPAPVATSQHAA